MLNDTIEQTLHMHGVRPTAVRILIYKAARQRVNTFTLQDLEDDLLTVDRSTIFRSLTLFAEHHLLHETEDGSGSKKYCVCHNDHNCGLDERHVHFYCERCRTTFCLDHTYIPAVMLPEGYVATDAEYVIKGICAKCGAKGQL